MSEYTKRLNEIVNSYEFIRCFGTKCRACGEQVFSIDEKIVEDKIRAHFMCTCGEDWGETVYSHKLKKYKYPQAHVVEIWDRKLGKIKVLKFFDRYYLVTPDKVMSKPVK